MTVQTFIPNSAQAASENTVTQPQHTPAIDGSVKKLYIETQGCQMNEYDSHRMADLLGDSHGYVLTQDPKEADILLMNTCSIREKAQEKVFSELGRWRKLKDKNPDLIIGVGGCVASQEGDNIQKRANYVDMIFGPQTLHRLPQMLDQHFDQIEKPKKEKIKLVDISFPDIEKFDFLPEPRVEGYKAFVSIMEGCSKYCSFCVVPYTRGEEVSRPLDDVLAEIATLAEKGVREISLLGQNVNGYRGETFEGNICTFAQFKQKLFNDITLNVNYDYREIDAETALLYLWSDSVDKATNSSGGLYPYTDTSKTTQNNADVYISAPFTLGGLQQEVVAGFMYNQSELTDRYYGSPTLDNGTIDFDDFTPSKIIGSINNNVANPSNKTTQTGAYLAGKFTLLEPLKLVTGVRVSNWEYESADGKGNRKFDNKVTPYAGLIYDFLEDYSWYASYTGIFKPEDKQSADGQYLDPREGKSYETGLKGEFFDKQLNASMSVFLTQQDNVAEKIGSIKIGDEFKDVYSSKDSVESKGFEIELDGKITNNWDMSFGIAHFNAEDANSKKVQTTAARTSANLFTKYTLDKWSLGGGLNYKSEAYKDEAAGRITQDAYVLANLMAAYQVDQNIKLQLNVNNLFDEKYYEGLGKNSMVYGAPRNATLTFRYQF